MNSSDENALEELLSRPDEATVSSLAKGEGDLIVLGAGGKMGPTVARMARRAFDAAGAHDRAVIAVSRFSDRSKAEALESYGIRTVTADLLDRGVTKQLPDAANVLWMAGQKFGSSANPVGTWASNVLAPSYTAERYAGSRIVCFSTGNVYGPSPVGNGGSRESDVLKPDGEYAASCIGRERVFQAVSLRTASPLFIFRLFYACDLRYGVLTDLALRVHRGDAIPLDTSWVNVIWQGDANRLALRAIEEAGTPATVLNITGAAVPVKELAEALAARLGKVAHFTGEPQNSVLTADITALRRTLPTEFLPLETLLDWTAEWVASGRRLLNKPTGYEQRDGRY